MFKLLFRQEWTFETILFAEYACHLSKEELEAKNWHMGVENVWKKRHFLKSFYEWASTKSKIPEMGQPKSGIPEMGQPKSGIPEMG